MVANTKFIIVGLSFMKSGSCKDKVNPPKNRTKIPVTIGIHGTFLSIYQAMGIAIKEVRTKKKVAFKNLSSIEKNME